MKTLRKYIIAGVLAIFASTLFWWNFADDLFARPEDDLSLQLRKFNYLLYKIREDYVEEPNMTELLDGAINGMLESLDPHSVYIPAEEQSRLTERFRGDFEGIGISFVIQNKILTVISPIPGTPSDRLGIRTGDKIIKIDGKSAYGITNEEVFEKLRGPKGTTVNVTIAREGIDEPLEFAIVRDKIPIHSVETSFMIDDQTGYILLNQFTTNTTPELEEALDDLMSQGMTQLIFDLRGNSGGYLDQAVNVADEFVPGGEKIVFTRGRDTSSETAYYSTDKTTKSNIDLIILINHGSASASEIVAGAVQDLDRGLVVGTRSFGKGLVQTPIPLGDGSLVRLTTSRYYTPSGRLIQRPYSDESISDYYREAFTDEDTTAEQPDSTREVFFTKGHRKIFGGGGIEPDIKLESSYFTAFGAKLLNQRLFFEYAAVYSAKHPEIASDFKDFLKNFQVSEAMLTEFLDLVKSKNIEIDQPDYAKDKIFFKNIIKAEIAQNLYNNRTYYYQVRIQGDDQVIRAGELFGDARKIADLWNK